MTNEKWVYGNREGKWYLVGNTDRDYSIGISQSEFKSIGEIRAKHKFMNPNMYHF